MTPAPSNRHNLLSVTDSFIGREEDMARVRQLLAENRGATLTGPPGCGKTRLALQVAEALLPEFEDGVWRVELGWLDETHLVPQAVADVLGVREPRCRTLSAVLADRIDRQQLLLLLDGCESTASGCLALAELLLDACPRLRILATSRVPLGLPGLPDWQVPALSFPTVERSADPVPASPPAQEGTAPSESAASPLVLPPVGQTAASFEGGGTAATSNPLIDCDAIRLFADRAGVVVPGFVISDTSLTTVARLCQWLQGNPLALELVASGLKWVPHDQVAAYLESALHYSSRLPHLAAGGGEPLEQILELSIGRLPLRERTLLRRLSIFAGGFSSDAALQVCGWDDLPAAAVPDALRELTERALVRVASPASVRRRKGPLAQPPRYELSRAVHEFVRRRPRRGREEDHSRRLMLEWLTTLAGQEAEAVGQPEHEASVAALEREAGNIRAVIGWIRAKRDTVSGPRLGSSLWRFWHSRGHWSEGSRLLKELLSSDREPPAGKPGSAGIAIDLPLEVRLLRGGTVVARLRWLWHHLTRPSVLLAGTGIAALLVIAWLTWHDTRSIINAAFVVAAITLQSLWVPIGHLWWRADALHGAARLAAARGDEEAGAILFRRSLACWALAGHREGVARVLLSRGREALRQDRPDEARICFDLALKILRICRSKDGISDALAALGDLHHRAELPPRCEEANALVSRAWAARMQGDLGAAAQLYEQALAAWRDIDLPQGIVATLAGLGAVALQRGDYQAAGDAYRESLATAFQRDARRVVGYPLLGLGCVATSLGQQGVARVRFHQALSVLQQYGDRALVCVALYDLGCVDLARREPTAAERRFRECLALALEFGLAGEVALAHTGMGRTAALRAEHPAACSYFRESLRHLLPLGRPMLLAEPLERLAASTAALGRTERAVSLWGAAASLRETTGAPLPPSERAEYEQSVAAARLTLDEAAFTAAWGEGKSLSPEEAVARALVEDQNG